MKMEEFLAAAKKVDDARTAVKVSEKEAVAATNRVAKKKVELQMAETEFETIKAAAEGALANVKAPEAKPTTAKK